MSQPLHPNQLRAGHPVRDFRVVRRLGVGGFAFVFLVEREGHPYTMKMAARPASEADEDRVDAWMCREVSSLESVEHPHLLPVLEWGRWPDPEAGYVYLVTPYVAGSTFHAWRWHERASLHRAVGVLCLLLKPLEALHERGMFHRDLKADNVLVREGDDWPFLIDLGAAHLPWAPPADGRAGAGDALLSAPGGHRLPGTEAARQGSRLPPRPAADLYAFGVLLYETLTNCRPFSTRLSMEACWWPSPPRRPWSPNGSRPTRPPRCAPWRGGCWTRSPDSAPRAPAPCARSSSGCARRRDTRPPGSPRRGCLPRTRE